MPNPASKPIIAIDIDDVIGAENEAVRNFINSHYGEKHTAEDYLTEGKYWSYWEDIWQVGKDEGRKRLEAFLNSPIKDNLKLVKGSRNSINTLKKRYELVIVTSRYGLQLKTTRPWLEKHFPKTFGQVAFVATWSKDKKVSKAVVCKQIGASYLIDDNAEHCNLAAEEGIQALLFGDYGWNRQVEVHPTVRRVKNWEEVLEYFDAAA
jgi:5'(3')-deoxyribonucleotidase